MGSVPDIVGNLIRFPSEVNITGGGDINQNTETNLRARKGGDGPDGKADKMASRISVYCLSL